ncbi:hyperosmotically inducible protein [Pseudidiomarina maritima]|jgi:hyperosmotically inducible protein|uniref:Hyperosmotically inducible protein n=1 Tax=Pseudidiomarina maritima TaxID=519453 RepID=A0A1I6HQE4_9GAMM|nr:BON domain-containing protein [Pseudidiomarina maritima]SFR56608.1 hyperosmotically inducible protein [Pseudidiomarina maritima]
MNTLNTLILASVAAVALSACSQQEQEETRKAAQSSLEQATEATKQAASDAAEFTRETAERTGDFLSDSAITARVKTALFEADQVSAGNINVETIDGHVVLSGVVATSEEADLAVQLAQGVEGVKSVENDIEVQE